MGLEPTHVTYSWMKDTSNGTADDFTNGSISDLYTDRDIYRYDDDVRECRLQVTSYLKSLFLYPLLHVKLVQQTCTLENKIFIQGKYKVTGGNVSLLIANITTTYSKYRLVGMVVKASASGAEDPEFDSRCTVGIFPGLFIYVT